MLLLRSSDPSEKQAWLPLWKSYLEFYGSDLPDAITDLTWQRFHRPHEPVNCIAAYDEKNMIGFATYILHRSTWADNYYCYLEDLFVDPKKRGKGVARQLIGAVKNAAKDNNCERLYWTTKEGNKTARLLYDKLAEKTDFLQYRIIL